MSKSTILCVDDEIIILNSLKSQLKRRFGSKYAYEAATNAADALELIDELSSEGVKVLIIVSDWMMPGIRGDEFLIQVHQKFPEIIKFMLTGQADNESVENAKKFAQLHHCFSKPWNESDLVAKIESILEGRTNE